MDLWYSVEALRFVVGMFMVIMVVLGTMCLYLAYAHSRDEELINQLAHDPVTDLPFEPLAIDQIVKTMQRVSNNWKTSVYIVVIFTDARGLKAVNAECGQSGGDQFLRAHARQLQSLVRSPDVVFRRGGGSRADELIAVMIAPESAQQVLQESRIPEIRSAIGTESVKIFLRNGQRRKFLLNPHVAIADRMCGVNEGDFHDVRAEIFATIDEADRRMEKQYADAFVQG